MVVSTQVSGVHWRRDLTELTPEEQVLNEVLEENRRLKARIRELTQRIKWLKDDQAYEEWEYQLAPWPDPDHDPYRPDGWHV